MGFAGHRPMASDRRVPAREDVPVADLACLPRYRWLDPGRMTG
jgi:hypothetical protein